MRPPFVSPPSRLAAMLWSSAASIALVGCFTPVPEGPPPGYERTWEACHNRFDDDGDRLVDCRDPDCIRQGFCNRRVPIVPYLEPENTPERCSDLIDNDDDGRFDCGDPNCTSILELCCSLEFDDASCSNGIDDDGNGFVDCADSGCSRNPFVTVCEFETDCANYIDDDGDRRVDCLDPDCAGAAHCVPGGEDACNDGDDDGDGRADCFDPDCYRDPMCRGPEDTLARCVDGNDNDQNGTADCAEPSCMRLTGDDQTVFRAYCEGLRGAENTLERCTDGVDNDGNGHTDCADFSCCGDRACSRPVTPEVGEYCRARQENTLERCTDGIDNDGNGFVDCNDFSCCGNRDCTMPVDPALTAICARGSENTLAACTDGIDNDGNGFVDCNDFSCCGDRGCTMPAVPEIGEYCRSRQENTLERCTDGIDNDGNGFVDCADFSCARSTDPDVALHCATAGERTFAQCTNGIDDDGNGFVDCNDFSCREVVEELVDDEHDRPTGYRRSPCRESVGAAIVELAFSRTNTSAAETLPAGLRVQTRGGIQFALFAPVRFEPGIATAMGTAYSVGDGFAANVPPGYVTELYRDDAVSFPDVTVTNPGVTRHDPARSNCADGIDNDHDGFIDCDDWDCNWNPVTRDLCLYPGLDRPRVCG